MSTLHIALDGNEANVSQRVGSNVYAFELLSALEKATRNKVGQYSFTVLLSLPKVAQLPRARRGWRYTVIGPKPFWTQWALPLHLWAKQDHYDLFFTPGHYGPRLSPVPIISSVMDTAYLEFPDQFKTKDFLQLKYWTRQTIKQAQHLITISEFSKSEIERLYAVPAESITVAYPAVKLKKSKKAPKDIKRKYRLPENYFVYVGTLQPRKNLVRLIEAYEKTHRYLLKHSTTKKSGRKKNLPKAEELALVLVGKEGWLAEPILNKINSSEIKDRIILTGFVSEAEKRALIEEATASIQVGLYEGFGIPPLESLALKTPVIVSNTSSLPEVVGEAGILVDPYDSQDIATGMINLLSLSARDRAQLIKKGRVQAKKFSWRSSAKLVLDSFEKVAKSATKK